MFIRGWIRHRTARRGRDQDERCEKAKMNRAGNRDWEACDSRPQTRRRKHREDRSTLRDTARRHSQPQRATDTERIGVRDVAATIEHRRHTLFGDTRGQRDLTRRVRVAPGIDLQCPLASPVRQKPCRRQAAHPSRPYRFFRPIRPRSLGSSGVATVALCSARDRVSPALRQPLSAYRGFTPSTNTSPSRSARVRTDRKPSA
jgi:hypothetical protein